ncbi:MAG: GNAT family N-acetyltransferase [Nitrospirae bacterium CG18_big_fil_WC_8_21_14_2_50_70_55]|nr:bifunctional acetate--CoA ligase family protein/GNAT family N-acetyltransferase [Deltaproteobacteria bacterium]OIP63328.1 MAG: GNAT family N-acetyltransferase [Nitrospirae bacterium CG2_30_70_394]PIQ05065.1 MAG: GNAT family N-acetyltransferase [Nitrospirae bacterium CG18_big_fil_WC_8_21_14_2_50_70_55]PIU78972.1 MAG: GNAT family N-acetyltransferase [Nitrospirae bacterium CG06_land_8_20_14_3_00_70_43]PIW83011.1 MAG: GNAT family N-acetyltransferase [Nitrospirae bacterium CG_4_8_14_3_um_filter_7
MSTEHLHSLFHPESVAIVGATNRPHAIGNLVMRNLLQGGFEGPVMPVNPKRQAVCGVLTYANVESLPVVPDMAVICTPPATVPELVDKLGSRGTRAITVLTAGLGAKGDDSHTLREQMMAAARRHGVRILGSNCLGLLVPGAQLNASFAHISALPGKIAFISQSGALGTAVIDWAGAHNIGFSHFVSLGDADDIDFGDLLDYLASDATTRAILLYIESVRDARKFLSAARAAARNKPVLVVKSGRVPEGAKAAASHTGALAGADDVYDAAFRRAGMLRVDDIDELFDAVETLARMQPLKGDRLAILTNGGGPGVMATDALIARGGHLATLAKETLAALDAVLPTSWSKGNPVDIIGDAPPERFAEATRILLADPGVDALLVMHVPTAVSLGIEAAQAVAAVAKASGRNVLTSWLGQVTAEPARQVFAQTGLPTYTTPDAAVRAFMHMVHYRRNQELLMETPPSIPEGFEPATTSARLLVENALAGGRATLTEPEAKAVLAAYGIPVVETHVATSPEGAARMATQIGFPVALKILSPEVSHKSDVGGVALELESGEAVREAAAAMILRVRELIPEANITGFTVQAMAHRPGAEELIVGMVDDSIFGPVILFGQGGVAVEVIGDHAVALPPLNMALASELIDRTRVAKLLKGYRDRAGANLDAICATLIRVAQLVIDIPEVVELDINPLFADAKGVLALDARMRVAVATCKGPERLAIRPYPRELEECVVLANGEHLLLRPIRPEDEPAHHEFVAHCDPDDIYFRFFRAVRHIPHSEMARLTQVDYAREMAFIAVAEDGGEGETLGVVRAITDPDNRIAEFGIMVRSDRKGSGLGHALLGKMIGYLRAQGTRELRAHVLPANHSMLALAERMGFTVQRLPEDEVMKIQLNLTGKPAGAATPAT